MSIPATMAFLAVDQDNRLRLEVEILDQYQLPLPMRVILRQRSFRVISCRPEMIRDGNAMTATGDFASIVRLEGVQKYFGAVHALRDIGLSIGRNEIVGLIGDNGAG